VAQPPFTFGLERVRELREHAESQAKEQLAASLSQRVKGAAQLAAASERLADAADSGRAQEGAVRSGQDLLAHERWMAVLERDRVAAEASLTHMDAHVRERRAQLGEASMRREVLERLKVRQRDEHVREAARLEGAELDEIALQQHVRRAS
jgi:flagellar FliJ protein